MKGSDRLLGLLAILILFTLIPLVSSAPVTPTQPQTLTYFFYLAVCLAMIYYSSILVVKNPLGKDIPTGEKAYEVKKRNEFIYYLNIMKSKFWIVGLFGIYIFLFLFFVLSNELVYNSEIGSLNEIFSNITYILAWGFIPFIIFWMGYMIITFYKVTTDTLKYQFGRIGRGNE